MSEYIVGDAFAELEAMPEASADVVCLDDAWARPRRGGGFGVEYPTHGFEDTAALVDECHRVLKPGGWLIADCDDWLLPKLTTYLIDEWGNAAETYREGYRKTGRVTLLSSDGSPDRSTPGQYLSTGGYPVVFAHKGETDRRCTASASQLADRPQDRHGWGSVKPTEPYRAWLSGLCEAGQHVVIPCAGTAPAAIAADPLGLEWTAIDCEQEAREAFRRRRESTKEPEQQVLA
jgi:SAM-dependent methyltransferase